MKWRIYLALLIGAGLSVCTQAEFQWAKRIASTAHEEIEFSIGMALDNQNNIHVTGWFDGTNDFGGVVLTNRGAGGQDIFVAKYDSGGALQWARQAGSATPDWNQGRGIGVDTNGNVYVTGGFHAETAFGNHVVNASGDLEFFLVKYSSAGEALWARQSIAGIGVYGTGLAVDAAGNSYAVGYADNGSPITFGTTNVLNPSSSGYSIFFVKYDSAGALEWAQLLGGSDDAYATKVALDSAGNVYVRGDFKQNITIGNRSLTASGPEEDMFVAKFDNAGALVWVQQIRGGNGGEGGVAVDQAGNVYISGPFETPVNFDGIRLTGRGAFDAFLAKYNSAGAIQWARRAGGTGLDIYFDVALDAHGNPHAAGVLSSDAIGPSGSGGAMAAKYDPSGTVLWNHSATGPAASPISSAALKVVVDSTGNTLLAGWYKTVTTFGANGLLPLNEWNFFLTKLATGDPSIAPTILAQPMAPAANVGDNINFTVLAEGTAPLNYQWRREGTNLLGATNANYSLLNVQLEQAGSFDVIVRNSAGSVTSAPPAVLIVRVPDLLPIITIQSTGSNLTLLVPITAAAYRTEVASTLSPPVTWRNVTGIVLTNDAALSIVFPFSGTQSFYRLINP